MVASGGNQLPRGTPEAFGVASGAVTAFLEAAEATGQELHGFMLLKRGTVIAEGSWQPYEAGRKRLSNSVSKSFTSAAIGIAVAEGKLSIEDAVVSFFEDEVPEQPDPKLSGMRVKHLLTMSTGHDVDTVVPVLKSGETDWVRAFLALPLAYEPGTVFKYNTGATYMLSAILQRVTGERLVDYLQDRLFAPLGIDNSAWDSCPAGITAGGWGLSLTTEEMARFGQLYLQQGMWEGKQLIPAEWASASVSPQIGNGDDPDSDWSSGYGYQFWCNRYGTYRADGAFGQIILVMPAEEAVLAFTSSLSDLSQILNAVWAHLLPALQKGSEPLPNEAQALEALRAKLASLEIAPPAAAIGVRHGGEHAEYLFEDNALGLASLRLHGEDEGCTIVWTLHEKTYAFEAGGEAWAISQWPSAPEVYHAEAKPVPADAAAVGRWQDDGSYLISIRLLDTAYHDAVHVRFEEEGHASITFARKFSVTPLHVGTLQAHPVQAARR
ncbi:serine hydrolase domain-containing protein [Paenibacillus methanolicus]|uniref:CubicO group peptidase (Beta-lactamase class C family) n=1 Tax=Paenibacillus methanolicus TaxID=582686 RepID=A0A5S5BPA4_9BACL|nr:serine hydrolase [Paenibacillus methanolicus]TYP68002.1 CubicO group peptidase (beta-lactamase class C family) [Paenibacillus methanolicus]